MQPKGPQVPAGVKIGEVLEQCKTELAALGEHEAAASAEAFLGEITGLPRTEIYLRREQLLTEEQTSLLRQWVARRKNREPVAYITGKAFFRDEVLKITPGCLIPRPETELLVQRFIENSGWEKDTAYRGADIGCGSGAIGISLLKYYSELRVCFTDIEAIPLEVTEENLKGAGISKRGEIRSGDLLSALPCDQKMDAIWSNPPYFSAEDWKDLQPEVQFEPRKAFDGGFDGLEYYRRLCKESPAHLRSGGWLVMEVGAGQSLQVRDLLETNFFETALIFKDYQNIERVVMARRA